MDNYIQFPRYSIYLIPNKLFIDQVEKLLLKKIVRNALLFKIKLLQVWSKISSI